MKKTWIIIGAIVGLLAVVIVCAGVYFSNTPEYALLKMARAVEQDGMEGLRPYLTEETQEKVDEISAIAESELVNSIMGLFNQNDYVGVLKSELQEVQWDVADIMKGKNNAAVILGFNYDDKLIGTIEISMIRKGGDWKIDGLHFPEFDEINW